jgi:hypothetical protein
LRYKDIMNACSTVLALHRWLLASLAALAFTVAPVAGDPAELEPLALSSKPVQLDPNDSTRQSIGRLSWRGGIEISSSKSRFGGLSGLLVSPDGAKLLAVSDTGRWLSATLSYDPEGRLTGIGDARMARLQDLDGDALKKKRWRDAESLARLADGSILVSFEHKHRIWRYGPQEAPLEGRPAEWPKPKGLDKAPDNGGLEALVALADGRLLALTEEQTNGTGTAGYLWHSDAWSPVTYRPHMAFKPTAASRLPGSDDLLVMERAFQPLSGPRVRLVRLAAGDIRPGAELQGEELARWGLPLTVDNFEALATRRGPGGETLIYMLSDDNFHLLQRTLLLMFALEEG